MEIKNNGKKVETKKNYQKILLPKTSQAVLCYTFNI